MMHLARVGRTDVHLSAVGFGTCQLRKLPESQALATLVRGFELGVNWVHTSPDYDGAEELVASAIRTSGRDVIPVSDGAGSVERFEFVFENTARVFGRRVLPMWGISCIDDQEFVGNDVWGPRGMVEFALKKKREGRIDALFCSTHGPPDYVANLITSGCFDAIMLAYNPLGFHVLSSYAAAEGKLVEDLAANRARIFRLAREHGVAILAMKPLAGGLLGHSKAFPPHHSRQTERERISATDVLRYILTQDGVTAVVPGTGNVEEAEENALAGYGPIELPAARAKALEERVAAMRRTTCSRCGACEPTCSKALPISWMFRDAYMWMNPADTFDAVGRLHYFHVHPSDTLECETCVERTCECPQGLDIPLELTRVHAGVLDMRRRGLLPRTLAELEVAALGRDPVVKLVHAEIPRRVSSAGAVCRLWLENAGERPWMCQSSEREHVTLEVLRDDELALRVPLRHDVHPGIRTHVAFELPASAAQRRARFRFVLARVPSDARTEVASEVIES